MTPGSSTPLGPRERPPAPGESTDGGPSAADRLSLLYEALLHMAARRRAMSAPRDVGGGASREVA